MKDLLTHRNAWDTIGAAHDELIGPNVRDQTGKIWTTKEGVICPGCERSAKVTRAGISRAMIRCLAWLYYNTRQGQYIHFNKAAPRPLVISASVGKLKHWTLIEQQPNVDDDSKNKSGYVMITNMGRAWLEKKVEVIKYRYLYNDRCVGQYGPLVGLVKYEAKKFHYTNDIMNSALWTPK